MFDAFIHNPVGFSQQFPDPFSPHNLLSPSFGVPMRTKPSEQGIRVKHHGAGPVAPCAFHLVDETPVGHAGKALLGKRWPCEVAAQGKPTLAVMGIDGGGGMDDKAFHLGAQPGGRGGRGI